MPKAAPKLGDRQVKALKTDGLHACGEGLYLQIKGTARTWVFRYQSDGKRRDMGLGSAIEVSLKEAREAVDAAKRSIREGIDPVDARRAERPTIPTFGAFADELIETLAKGFRNEKHRTQWATTLGKVPYDLSKVRIDADVHSRHVAALTALRAKKIDEVSTGDVLAVLTPIWSLANETASRVRGRIEKVLDAAKVKGLRTGENPAAWRGHLVNVLPKRQKLQRGHHRALPYAEIPGFVADLRARDAIAARALEFTILTAVRTSETLKMPWSEIDLVEGVWNVPAPRTKAGRDHRIPLSSRAVEILREVAELRTTGEPNEHVFPGQKVGHPLSSMSMLMLLRRMGMNEAATVHGFRSTLRDWAGDATEFARETAEAALSHAVGDATERAYRRGDALAKRRMLMDAWAAYCEPKPDNVVPLMHPSNTPRA